MEKLVVGSTYITLLSPEFIITHCQQVIVSFLWNFWDSRVIDEMFGIYKNKFIFPNRKILLQMLNLYYIISEFLIKTCYSIIL